MLVGSDAALRDSLAARLRLEPDVEVVPQESESPAVILVSDPYPLERLLQRYQSSRIVVRAPQARAHRWNAYLGKGVEMVDNLASYPDLLKVLRRQESQG